MSNPFYFPQLAKSFDPFGAFIEGRQLAQRQQAQQLQMQLARTREARAAQNDVRRAAIEAQKLSLAERGMDIRERESRRNRGGGGATTLGRYTQPSKSDQAKYENLRGINNYNGPEAGYYGASSDPNYKGVPAPTAASDYFAPPVVRGLARDILPGQSGVDALARLPRTEARVLGAYAELQPTTEYHPMAQSLDDQFAFEDRKAMAAQAREAARDASLEPHVIPGAQYDHNKRSFAEDLNDATDENTPDESTLENPFDFPL
jgi:type II secretory pathway pseudopilin PulG